MALSTTQPATKAAGWLAPIYGAALVLIFTGERIVTSDGMRMGLSGLGVAALIAVTALRFVRAQQADGERRAAERTLALLAALGLVALGLYFTTTETARNLLGIAKAAPETRARIEAFTMVAWAALLLIALVPMLFGELAIAPMRNAPRIEARRVRSAIAAGFSIAFAAVYCALFTYAAGTLDSKVDFSYFRTARPSESTRNVAASVTDPIKVTAFFPQLNDVGAEAEGYLRELGAAAPNLKIEVHDRLLVPAVAKEAKVTQDGVIVLSRGPSRETLSVGFEMKTAQAKLKSLDGDFQKALLKVMREARIAYVTVGHGELNETQATPPADGRTAKNFRKLLESQNYSVKDLGLVQGLATDVPADATIVAVLGPATALLPEEIATLKRYGDRGGHVLLALDPQAKADHRALAEAFGVVWQPEVLANDKVFLRHRFNESDRILLATNRFSSHASVSTVSRSSARAHVVFPGAAALDKKEGGDLKIDFAVKALPDTFNDVNGDFELTQGTEKRSAYNLAAAVSKAVPKPEGYKGKDGPELRAFVIGDADVISDPAFGVEPNVYFTLDVIRWLGGEESFSGSIATTEDVRIEHTTQKDKLWFWATIGVAPSLVLGLGLVVTRRKKRVQPAKEKNV